MPVELTSAQRRLLHLTGPFAPRSDASLTPLAHIVVLPSATRVLRDLLATPGGPVGGPLYGRAEDGVLRVHLVAAAGYAWREQQDDPLALDAPYTLGHSDAVQALSGSRLVWAGHWLALPLRQYPGDAERLHWQERALAAGLLDRAHPCCCPAGATTHWRRRLYAPRPEEGGVRSAWSSGRVVGARSAYGELPGQLHAQKSIRSLDTGRTRRYAINRYGRGRSCYALQYCKIYLYPRRRKGILSVPTSKSLTRLTARIPGLLNESLPEQELWPPYNYDARVLGYTLPTSADPLKERWP